MIERLEHVCEIDYYADNSNPILRCTMAIGRPVALVLLLLMTTAGIPQQADKKQRDPQSTYEPRSAPGVGQKFLEKFVGEWDVGKTFYPVGGKPAQMQGKCRQTMVQEGRFL